MENILVTAIGSFAADIVIKKMKMKGFRVIGCDIYPKEWLADAYQVNEFYQVPYATDTEAYMQLIQEICRKEDVKYIIPLTDVEVDVYNKNREWFLKNNVCLCISSQETLEYCRNKKKLEQIISKTGYVQTIPTTMLRDMEVPPRVFPVVCKPYDGRSSEGLEYVHNFNEWEAVVRRPDKDRYIFQPYISGDIITADIVRQIDGKRTVVVARRELLRTQNGAGISVYVFRDKELEKVCIDIADILNVVGCVNFEFIQDDKDRYYLLECNPRFSGGAEFTCIAGYDCVTNHIKCFQRKRIDSFLLTHNQYICRKYEEYVTSIE